jgi:hypothetical protein
VKANVETLQDMFRIGYNAYADSRAEASHIWDLYHNRQFTPDQIAVLQKRGQPVETFNVIKLFARMLLGYYSSVVNTVRVLPTHERDIATASLVNDIVNYTLRHNNFDSEGDKLKLSGLISGLMVSYIDPVDMPQKDEYGRPYRDIKVSHVPDSEVVLDPLSRLEDYSDARFIHRFSWISEDMVVKTFGKEFVEQLEAYHNHLEIEEAEFEYSYNGEFVGKYKLHNNYLIVHSNIVDEDDKTWSIFWSGDIELSRKEITYKEVKFSYRVQKVHTSNRTEFYGIFREVAETQKAINQALIKIQLMVNTQKIFVEEGAVENIAEFESAVNRVSGIIPVRDLAGVKVENLSREVLDQYTIIDKAFDRIQRVLSINDSFLGMAFASDSGRKVKLQQNATVTALRYLTARIEQFYKLIGWDIANLAKQYYTAHQFLRIADESQAQRWVEINKPLELQGNQIDPTTGQPKVEAVFEEVLDPASGEPEVDEEGNIVVAPIPEADSEIAFTDIDIEIQSVAYNDEDEKNQLMMETMLSGAVGNMLAQVNPAGYFKASALAVKTMKTKHSPDISNILDQTAMMLSGNPQAEQEASAMAQGGGGQTSSPLSASQKLPQNTNEPV